jgi:hypothetical protein
MRRQGLALLVLAAALAVATATGAATAGGTTRSSADAAHCKKVGKGHLWHYNGKSGRLFTVEGDRPSACVVGITWLYRLTTIVGTPKTPPGWRCETTPPDNIGQTETRNTPAIIERDYRPA